ncbi:MAG: hypothetical protein Q9169_006639 [Polycauliona sp. 2 TL-2023]
MADCVYLQIPGFTGYGSDCSSQNTDYTDLSQFRQRLGNGCEWQDKWLGTWNSTVLKNNRESVKVNYEEATCTEAIFHWAFCDLEAKYNNTEASIPTGTATPSTPSGNNTLSAPIGDETNADQLDKKSKIAIGVSTIPLLVPILSVILYCIKRRPTPPPEDPAAPSPKPIRQEQTRWDKPELPPACIQEICDRSMLELETRYLGTDVEPPYHQSKELSQYQSAFLRVTASAEGLGERCMIHHRNETTAEGTRPKENSFSVSIF